MAQLTQVPAQMHLARDRNARITPMEILQLFEMATNFRRAIESIPPKVRPIGMQRFPNGACGDTALLFGTFLVDHSIPGFKYICGERGSKIDNTWTSHAWLQHDDLVVDLTADQFPDASAGVIVSSPSPWHMQFSTEPGRESDFREWSGYGAELLHPMYSRVLTVLSSKFSAQLDGQADADTGQHGLS